MEYNLTIKELSKLAYVSENTITNIEKTYSIPNISTLNKLCQTLNIDRAYILGSDSWPESIPKEIIYKYRIIAGLSQRDLAKKTNLHQSTIQDYEKGKLRNPDTLKIIYAAIGYI